MADDFDRAITAATEEEPSPHDPRATASLGPLETSIGAPLDLPAADRYQPKDLLGRGGMGEVELTTDRLIGRDVALKRMRPEFLDRADSRQRFVHEARVQARLEHPGVVPVYDLGIDRNGSPYFTMKRVLGVTLREVVGAIAAGDVTVEKKYPVAQRLSLFRQVCLAVEYAHTRSIIHRDLKPSNIMLGDFGEVYVLDWGLAKAQDPASEEAQRAPATLKGTVLGTYGYMSPEQASGSILTPRSDIYALGAILYEILALRPFDKMHEPGEPDIPPELAAIYRRATKPSPDERFASARALADAVQAFLDGDRDLELRRSLAKEHTDRAEQIMAAELGRDPIAEEKGRAAALREITAALALDPNNDTARQLLVRLLLEPPKILPKALERDLAESLQTRQRLSARNGMIAAFVLFVFLPLGWWLNVRQPSLMFLCGAFLCVFAASSLMNAGGKGNMKVFKMLALLSALAFIVVASRIFGPLILFPAIAGHIIAPMAINSSVRMTTFAIVAGVSAVLGPVIGEAFGLLPKSYLFQDGMMCVVPQMVDLPETASLVTLAIGNTFPIIFAGVLAGRIGALVRRSEQQTLSQAWHLKTLLGPSKR